MNKGHDRIEKPAVSIIHLLEQIPDFPCLQTLIRFESECVVHHATIIAVSTETSY